MNIVNNKVGMILSISHDGAVDVRSIVLFFITVNTEVVIIGTNEG